MSTCHCSRWTEEDTSWASWMAPLMACVTATQGAVLEVGIGDFSTPFLHMYCAASGRQLRSVEDNPEWAEKFAEFDVSGHDVVSANLDQFLQKASREVWSVVLMDHSPGSRRADDALLFKDSAKFILVHDYSGAEVAERFTPEVLANWQSVHVAEYSPSTLVLSQVQIPWWPKFRQVK